MHIYILNLGLIPVWAALTSVIQNKKQRKSVITTILFSQLFLLSALRSPLVSYDTITYIGIYNKVKEISFFDFTGLQNATTLEVGFSYFIKLLSFISMSSLFYIAVMAGVSLLLIKQCIDKKSKIVWLSYYLLVSLGFYTSLLSMLRQGLAMAIIMLSYNYLEKSRRVIFFALVLLAFSIHQTAAIFTIMYFFKDKRINNKALYTFLIVLPIVYLFSNKILGILFKFTKYGYRLERAIAGQGQTLLLVYIIVFIAAVIFKNNVVKQDSADSRLYFIAAITVICQILALQFSLFSRVGLYFSIFQVILIPNVLASIKDSRIRILGIFSVVIFTPVLLYVNLCKNLGGVVPYFFFWQ